MQYFSLLQCNTSTLSDGGVTIGVYICTLQFEDRFTRELFKARPAYRIRQEVKIWPEATWSTGHLFPGLKTGQVCNIANHSNGPNANSLHRYPCTLKSQNDNENHHIQHFH